MSTKLQLDEFKRNDGESSIQQVLTNRKYNKKLELEISKDEDAIEPPARSNRSIKMKMSLRNRSVIADQPRKDGEESDIGITSRKSEEI